MPAAVTPSGVRDGDPAALAGLCAARGPSVLAYCRHVAGDADAGEAAADAFASFRAAVVATEDLADLNPEALLIDATRNAAARHAPRAPLDVCAVVPLLLAARADKTISAADSETLDQHLESCWNCRAPVARFEAAERAYGDPPGPQMEPAIAAGIIAAMAAAGPAPADAADPSAPVSNGGSGPSPATEDIPVAGDEPAADRIDGPTTEFRAPDVLESDRVAVEAAAVAGHAAAEPARHGPEPESELVRGRSAARGAIGARIPRARRQPPARKARAAPAPVLELAGSRSRGRSRSGLPLPIVLPVAVVLLAVLGALFVSGVFGGDDPASSPRVAVPSDEPPVQSTPADVVVVPGAEEASPDDVESAKARERASERRKREAASGRRAAPEPAAARRTPTPATTPPPAAAVPPPPPPPPPPPATKDKSRKVDAGKGATGAEQIPPAADTSTVPDLAPAPEPATAP
jgi:hypothetical protein